jgi:hypothetical protein
MGALLAQVALFYHYMRLSDGWEGPSQKISLSWTAPSSSVAVHQTIPTTKTKRPEVSRKTLSLTTSAFDNEIQLNQELPSLQTRPTTTKQQHHVDVGSIVHHHKNYTHHESEWHPLPQSYFNIPFPVFVASLPKSGTTSIHSFFLCGRVRSVHHFCPRQVRLGALMARNIRNNTPPFAGCGGGPIMTIRQGTTTGAANSSVLSQHDGNETDDSSEQLLGPVHVFTDTGYVSPGGPCYYPSLSALQHMYDHYPNMTIVLGTRNSTKWYQSIRTWGKGSLLKRWIKYCNFMSHHPSPRDDVRTNSSHNNNNTNRENDDYFDQKTFMNFYEWHNHHVRTFAQQHASMTFLEIAIDSPHAATLLEQRTNISSACWGHSKPLDTRAVPRKKRARVKIMS